MQASLFSNEFSSIAEKVEHGERLSFDDGVKLYESDDLVSIGAMANFLREKINGNSTYYNVNRHMNYTNVCISDCATLSPSVESSITLQ